MRYDGRSNGTIGIRNSGTQDVCSNDIQKLCTLCKDCAKIGHIVQKQECVGSGDKEKFLYRNHEITQDYTRLTQKSCGNLCNFVVPTQSTRACSKSLEMKRRIL